MSSAPVPGTFMVHGNASLTNTSLAKALRAQPAHVQNSGKIILRASRKLHLPRHFGQFGPAQRIRVLRPDATTSRAMIRFVFEATSANLLKQVRGSPPSMASAYNCYTAFCEMRKAPFPVLGGGSFNGVRSSGSPPPMGITSPSCGVVFSFVSRPRGAPPRSSTSPRVGRNVRAAASASRSPFGVICRRRSLIANLPTSSSHKLLSSLSSFSPECLRGRESSALLLLGRHCDFLSASRECANRISRGSGWPLSDRRSFLAQEYRIWLHPSSPLFLRTRSCPRTSPVPGPHPMATNSPHGGTRPTPFPRSQQAEL